FLYTIYSLTCPSFRGLTHCDKFFILIVESTLSHPKMRERWSKIKIINKTVKLQDVFIFRNAVLKIE
ncbi:MAG TPA: hypothetical protein PLU49_12350, partial [Saprospiraceae bacterium]|nr:hypothetical protein [Saprospiraceae bacterium]